MSRADCIMMIRDEEEARIGSAPFLHFLGLSQQLYYYSFSILLFQNYLDRIQHIKYACNKSSIVIFFKKDLTGCLLFFFPKFL